MRNLFVAILIGCAMYSSLAQERPSYASSTICLPVSNLEQSISWYTKLLGEVERFSPADGIMEFQLNEKTWLQLFEGAPTSGSILRLEVENIQQHHQRLEELGLSPTSIELVPEVVSFFDFKDPDGNMLSFYKLESP